MRKTDNDTGPKAFRWRLIGARLPPLVAAYRVGHATRAAVYRNAETHGLMPLPDSFHRSSDQSHTHAFWLPEDADGDGRIDHVLLFAACGIPWNLLPVLAMRLPLRLADLGKWTLLPAAMGESIAAAPLGSARRWAPATAYVPPLKGRQERGDGTSRILLPEQQLRWEIGERRLGVRLVHLSFSNTLKRGRAEVSADDFVLHARRLRRLPPGMPAPEHWSAPVDARGVAAELIFDRPVCGPLAFGFGAHFGLGLFAPAH